MHRSGRTLVELLVVLVVLAILLAVFLPWLQARRELARAAECRQRLHRIGLALSYYESTYQCFPPAVVGPVYWDTAYHNWVALLLPAMSRNDVVAQIDSFRKSWGEKRYRAYQRELGQVILPEFRCPGETASPRIKSGPAYINYAGNAGSGFQSYGFNGLFRPCGEPLALERRGIVQRVDVVDGLSNTAAISEALQGIRELDRLRTIWQTPHAYTQPIQLDDFADLCASVPVQAQRYGWDGLYLSRGIPWFGSNVSETLYNHVLGPNQPSCTQGANVQEGAYSATSLHGGGCHVLMADERVEFVSDLIDRTVWREMGSRVDHDLLW